MRDILKALRTTVEVVQGDALRTGREDFSPQTHRHSLLSECPGESLLERQIYC